MDKRARYLLDTDPKTAKARDVDDATVRFKYLLGLTDLFRHFIDLNALHDPHFKQMVRQVDANLASGGGGGAHAAAAPARAGRRKQRRKTEKEEDAELLQEEHAELEERHEPATVLTELPLFVQLGTLREYQILGLNWLILLYENRLSGILADEMGLGKTLQTIAFLGYLRHVRRVEGPFIVIVPKSTLDNWRREFAKWTPEVDAVVLQGDRDARRRVIEERLLTAHFDVLITSFEMVIREKLQLKKFRWQYLIVDEAHRIKNEASSLLQIIRLFYLKNRLLITGTPLQNNLHELWALLNFLLPDVFGEAEVFDRWFEGEADAPDGAADGTAPSPRAAAARPPGDRLVHQLHQILQPFLLRRVKADVEKSLLPKIETNVYIGMSDMQLRWYRKLLEKDIDAVNGVVGKREGKTRLLNIVMQLRKCCNHPYLFDGAEPGPPFTTDEHLVFNSGKMIVLDKMLAKFRADGSRVLIFLQMLRLLDILEDYCYLRDYEYCRIDGLTTHEDRIEAIDQYNAPNLDKFIFLLTTRAGGLGINLTSADIVILFDLDWNPQADLQAMDRAHRIGQKKQVRVFRFVTEFAIEEKVLERAAQKLRLDQLVIQQGRQQLQPPGIANNKEDLLGMIQHGARQVFEAATLSKTNEPGASTSLLLDTDIDALLAKGAEKTATLNAKFNKLGLDDLHNFTSDSSTYEWNGQNFAKRDAAEGAFHWINPAKRERKEQTYSVDNYYKEVLAQKLTAESKSATGTSKPKPPKLYNVQDHQFFPAELVSLLEREQLEYKKLTGYKYSVDEFGDTDDEFLEDAGDGDGEMTREQKRHSFQRKVDEVVPLSDEEIRRKDEMLATLFWLWSRRDFTNFIHGSAKFGRDNYTLIAREAMGANKSADEVERYLNKFWGGGFRQIDGYEKYILQIENSERKLAKLLNQQRLLALKMEAVRHPLEELKIQYPPNNSKRVYSKTEDRFILYCVHKLGLFTDNLMEKIKEEISESDLFRFDWFLLSRTPQELGRRVNTLLLAITREMDGPAKKRAKVRPSPLKTEAE
jgi:SWI/SNF-related matrix-associated actin-dependent regulator of chromatin subfamily A member 5